MVSAPRRLGMPSVLKCVGWFQDKDVPWAYCSQVGPLGVPLSFFTPQGPSFWSFLRVVCYYAYFLENTAPSTALLVSCLKALVVWDPKLSKMETESRAPVFVLSPPSWLWVQGGQLRHASVPTMHCTLEP